VEPKAAPNLLDYFKLYLAQVCFELGGKLNQDWKIGADGSALPLVNQIGDLALLTLEVKRLVAVLRVMIDNNRFFDSNAIANFHSA
jgi:hypothetical protein